MSGTPIMDIAMQGHHRQRHAPGTLRFETTLPPAPADAAQIAAHIANLPCAWPWTPARDLMLVTLLRSGMKLDQAAATIPGVTRSQALQRWNKLMLDTSIETQIATHAALRRRAEEVPHEA
ncbi:hypothetical protein [Pseudooceanicola sp.]|uniref:hypothetical protein n=1 Tax=Pseudooceanicola sp. TaxID=1914328 RepID=UPI0035C6DB96